MEPATGEDSREPLDCTTVDERHAQGHSPPYISSTSFALPAEMYLPTSATRAGAPSVVFRVHGSSHCDLTAAVPRDAVVRLYPLKPQRETAIAQLLPRCYPEEIANHN
jgi:hypothetical protein